MIIPFLRASQEWQASKDNPSTKMSKVKNTNNAQKQKEAYAGKGKIYYVLILYNHVLILLLLTFNINLTNINTYVFASENEISVLYNIIKNVFIPWKINDNGKIICVRLTLNYD